VAALAAWPAVADAQQVGALAGLVYDSLIGAPLAGAQVFVRGAARSGVTDRAGRFRIDSLLAGTHVVSFDHPELDSIGLPANAARVMVPAGGTFEIVLATRSAATLRRAACGERPTGPHGDSSFVFGDVRDAESGVRLAGALVSAAWIAITRTARGLVTTAPATVAARTDSLGSFYLCGLTNEVGLTLQARADSFASGAIDVQVGPRMLLRRDLTISREPLRVVSRGALRPSAVMTESSAVRRGSAVLTGTVTEEQGAPRAGAWVSVESAGAETVTDERGRFVLAGLPAGTQMVTARMVGYVATRVPVDLRGRDTTRLSLRVRAITLLDTLTVVARGPRERLLAEIDERRRVTGGFVLHEEDIRRRGNTRSLFFGMANVLTEGTGAVRYNLYIQQGGNRICIPTMYIDGVRAGVLELQAWRNEYLVAVEVYPRPSAALGRFQSPEDCGVVLVWTRLLR
jgi:hypothetical protein